MTGGYRWILYPHRTTLLAVEKIEAYSRKKREVDLKMPQQHASYIAPLKPHNSVLGRDRIVEVATDLISHSGYTAMSMRALATEVGILPGSLYHHFANKQELLGEVLIRLQTERFYRIAEASKFPQPDQALDAFIECIWGEIRDNPQLVFLKSEARHLQEDDKEEYREQELALVSVLASILQKGVRRGLYLVEDFYVAARAIMAMIETVACQPDGNKSSLKLLACKLVGK